MTKTCKLLAALLLVTLLLGSIVIPSSAATGYLTGASNGVTLEAGSAGSIPFTISFPTTVYLPGYGTSTSIPMIAGNAGIVSQITATLDLGSATGINLSGSSYMQFGQMMRGGSVNGSFDVWVAEDTKPASTTVTVNVSYNFYSFVADAENPFGGTLSDTPTPCSLTIDVPVTIVNKKYEALTAKDVFDITRRDIPTSVVAGEAFTTSLTVKNTSGYRLEGVTVSLDAPNCYFDDDTSVKTLDILANGTARASFKLKASPSAAAGSHQVKATVSYLNPAGETVSRDFYMLLNIEAAATALPADVKITEFVLPESIKAGDLFSVRVTVQNVSAEQTAESLTLGLSQQSGLQTRSSTKLTVPTLAPGESATLTVDYAAPADAASIYCLFTADYTYSTAGITGDKETRSQDNGVYLTEREKPALEITGISIPASVYAEHDFTLTVTLRNNGGAAENLYFSIEPDAGFVYKSSTSKIIKSLASGESTTLSFKLYGSDTITEGYKSIRLTCSSGQDTLLEEYTGTNMIVPEKEDETKNTDVPVIIISSYDYGESVFGGQTFTLSLEFRNTSKTTAAKDLKITVSSSSEDGVTAFTPANSSNTFFIEELAPQATVTQSIDLLVKGDLAPKSYGIFIRLEYKNGAGTASDSADETLAIPVKQEVRFNIGEISSLTDITTMEEAYLTATFGNLGKSTIYNVIVKVTGEGFSCYSPEYYAGNIEAGKHLSYDFYLTPNGAGMASGTISYSYEDANGEKFSETQEFSFNIMESANNMGGMIDVGMEPIFDEATGYYIDPMTGEYLDPETMMPVDPSALAEGGLPSWFWYAVGGGALVVLVVVIVLVRRAKKRKQEEEDADL